MGVLLFRFSPSSFNSASGAPPDVWRSEAASGQSARFDSPLKLQQQIPHTAEALKIYKVHKCTLDHTIAYINGAEQLFVKNLLKVVTK